MLFMLQSAELFQADWKPGEILTVFRKLSLGDKREKIPTTFVSMSPDKLVVEKNIDVLVGVFHIMWEDMPRRRTYHLKLEDLVSPEGYYIGASLKCGGIITSLIES